MLIITTIRRCTKHTASTPSTMRVSSAVHLCCSSRDTLLHILACNQNPGPGSRTPRNQASSFLTVTGPCPETFFGSGDRRIGAQTAAAAVHHMDHVQTHTHTQGERENTHTLSENCVKITPRFANGTTGSPAACEWATHRACKRTLYCSRRWKS